MTSAVAYQRRRLRAAFTTLSTRAGAAPRPGVRAAAGLFLTVSVIGAHLLVGRLPGAALPAGWSDNALVMTTDGARYVALDGALHPVANGLSARLARPVGSATYTVAADTLTGLPRSAPIGIPGLPEEVGQIRPTDRWWACLDGAGSVGITLGGGPPPGPWSTVARVGGRLSVLSEGVRLPLPSSHESATLRALGLDLRAPLPAPPAWSAVFRTAAELAPLELPGAGADAGVAGAPLTVGAIVAIRADPRRYVVTAPGRLAPLTPLALAMYQVGGGGAVRTVTEDDLAGLATDPSPVSPAQWPSRIGRPLDGSVCAVLVAGSTATVTLAPGPPTPRQGSSTVARADGTTYLLTGESAFPLPEPADEAAARLGLTSTEPVEIPATWLALFAAGPRLDPGDAARPRPHDIR